MTYTIYVYKMAGTSYVDNFSDISDDESSLVTFPVATVNDIDFPDFELSQADIDSLKDVIDNKPEISVDSRFREPVAHDYVSKVQGSRFPTKTVNNATWAVSLFGDGKGVNITLNISINSK